MPSRDKSNKNLESCEQNDGLEEPKGRLPFTLLGQQLNQPSTGSVQLWHWKGDSEQWSPSLVSEFTSAGCLLYLHKLGHKSKGWESGTLPLPYLYPITCAYLKYPSSSFVMFNAGLEYDGVGQGQGKEKRK